MAGDFKIPLKWKAPTVSFLRELGRVPFSIACQHSRRVYVESFDSTQEQKNAAYAGVRRAVGQYLNRHYSSVCAAAAAQVRQGEMPETAPVWVFWWQGLEQAPRLIRHCIASVKRNAGGRPVIVIDRDNYGKYALVPEHILEKLHTKKMSITHFSDYYRMLLLATHGGLWLDASVYVNRPIPEDVFARPIYTIRNPGEDKINISGWEWTIGILGGWRGNSLFQVVETLLSAYWKDHDRVVDYYNTDYLVRLVYDTCPEIRAMIQDIPVNNRGFYDLQNCSRLALDDPAWQLGRDKDTWLWKISWKADYPASTEDGKQTVYGWWEES